MIGRMDGCFKGRLQEILAFRIFLDFFVFLIIGVDMIELIDFFGDAGIIRNNVLRPLPAFPHQPLCQRGVREQPDIHEDAKDEDARGSGAHGARVDAQEKSTDCHRQHIDDILREIPGLAWQVIHERDEFAYPDGMDASLEFRNETIVQLLSYKLELSCGKECVKRVFYIPNHGNHKDKTDEEHEISTDPPRRLFADRGIIQEFVKLFREPDGLQKIQYREC